MYSEGTATEKHRRVAAGDGVMAGMGWNKEWIGMDWLSALMGSRDN